MDNQKFFMQMMKEHASEEDQLVQTHKAKMFKRRLKDFQSPSIKPLAEFFGTGCVHACSCCVRHACNARQEAGGRRQEAGTCALLVYQVSTSHPPVLFVWCMAIQMPSSAV